MNLGTEDVGRRVVIRYRLDEPAGHAAATDVIGVLDAWADGTLRVTTADGRTVEVDETKVIAAKPVPPRTVRRSEVRDLEAAAAAGWRALETEWLGGWFLRASDGFTRRANSCLPLGDPSMPIATAVDAVRRWYDARTLPPAFQLPLPLAGALGRTLDAAGWTVASEDVLVMTASIADVAAAARPDLPPVRVDTEPDGAWLASYHYRGDELPPAARRVLVNAELVGFASVDDGDERAAIARGAVTSSPSGRRWIGITAVEVARRHRRRGLGTHIVAGLASWAGEHAATDVYLQVSADNAAAIATYAKLGFVEHHRYHYRRAPE